jgi:cyanophycinase
MRQFNKTSLHTYALFSYRFVFQLIFLLVFLLMLLLSWTALPVYAQDLPASQTQQDSKGSLLIIGGALRQDNATVWNKLVQSAGGKQSKIAIIPTASGNPERAANFALETIKLYGGNAYILPLSTKYERQPKIINRDPHWIEQINQATGVYFTGGDQGRITQALVNEDGQPSPMLNAIWRLYQRGGIIAGTSAGAAIMSSTMFHEARDSLTMLKMGITDGKEIAPGLGFIGKEIFIDQHLIIRGRFARMLPAMLKKNYKFGIGVDENTGLFIQENQLEVIGYKGAVLLNLSAATTRKDIKEFNLNHAYISFLSYGDKLDLQSMQTIPSADKSIINSPQSEDRDQHVPFYPNILGNTTVIELMSALIESKHQTAKGLAMGDANSIKPELGFEFEFNKTKESKGYFSSQSGAESFTLLNIRMDVRPVKIKHPIYTVD